MSPIRRAIRRRATTAGAVCLALATTFTLAQAPALADPPDDPPPASEVFWGLGSSTLQGRSPDIESWGDNQIWWFEMYNYLGWVFSGNSYSVSLARNEREGFQAFFWEKTEGFSHQIRLEVTDFTGPGGATLTPTVYNERYMWALGGGFGSDAGMGHYADALVPYNGEYLLADLNNSLAWYIELQTAKDSTPGDYTATVRIYEEGSATPLRITPVTAHVWDFALPEGHYATTAFGNFNQASGYWLTDSLVMASGYGNPIGNTDAEDAAGAKAVIKAWYDLLLDHGISGYELPWGLIDDDPRAAAEYLYDPRVTSVSIPYNAQQPWLWTSQTAKYYEILSQYPEMLDKAYFYTMDEQPAAEYVSAWIDEALYWIKGMWDDNPHLIGTFGAAVPDAEENTVADYVAQYANRVDVWVPIANSWIADYEGLTAASQQVKADGGKLWMYPGGFPLASLDLFFYNGINPGLDRRALLWQAYKLGVEGILYWQTADWENWSQGGHSYWDPWQEGGNYVQNNGQAQLVYPAASLGLDSTDLIASLRLKQFADGLDDYDYLTLAEMVLGEEALQPILDSMLVEQEEGNPGSIVAAGWAYRPNNWSGQLDYARKLLGDAIEAAGFEYTCGEWSEYLAPDATHEGLELRTCDGGAQESRRTPMLTAPTLTTPVLTGTPVQGNTLTVTADVTPDDADTTVTFEWLSGETVVATSSTTGGGTKTATYTVQASDQGKSVKVRVTASRPGVDPLVKYSNVLQIDQDAYIGSVTVTGDRVVGGTLEATANDVRPPGAVLTYQWMRADGSVIAGATSSTYIVQEGDEGGTISVNVTATAPNNTRAYASSANVVIAWRPVTLGTVTISGSAQVGGTLTANVASVWPATATLSYQWYRGSTLVAGPSAQPQYLVSAADEGQSLKVQVTASAPYRTSAVKDSTPVTVGWRPVTLGAITISGSATVGSTLTASVASVFPTDATLSYEWYRGSTRVAGPSSSNQYVVQVADGANQLQVKVTATAASRTAATGTATTATIPQAQASIGTLTVLGTFKVGQTVSASSTGLYPSGQAYVTYEWYRGDTLVHGPSPFATYTIQAADGAQPFTLVATVTAPNCLDGQEIYGPVMVEGTAPTFAVNITGTPGVAQTLTAEVTNLDPADATLSYEWYRGSTLVAGPSTQPQYLVSGGDEGQNLYVKVTATAPYRPQTVRYSPLVTVPWRPAALGAVSLSGTAEVGETLTASVASVFPADATVTYEWYRGSTRVAGPRSSNQYTVVAADTGYQLEVRVTATAPSRVSATGSATSAVVIQTLSLSQTQWNTTDQAQSMSLQVTTTCSAWSTSTSASWLTRNVTYGVRNTTVTVTVSANATSGTRTATLTVGGCGQTAQLTVTQAARATMTLSPTSWAAPVPGGSQRVTITTNQPSWKVTIPAAASAWLTADKTSGAAGEYPTLTAATGGTARSAVVTFAAGSRTVTFLVTQAAATLTLSPAGTWLPVNSGATRTVTVTTNLGQWTATGPAWVSFDTTTGTTGQKFTLTAQPNTGAARTGTVTVTALGLTRTFTVTQAAATLTLAPASWAAPWGGGSTAVRVTASVGTWRVANASLLPAWLTVSHRESVVGVSGDYVVVQAARNEGAARSATVTIVAGDLSKTLTVTQAAAAAATLTVSPTTWSPTNGVNSLLVTVTSNRTNWQATSDSAWLHVCDSVSGGWLVLGVDANTTSVRRVGRVTVTAGTVSRVITVTQAAGPTPVQLEPGQVWLDPLILDATAYSLMNAWNDRGGYTKLAATDNATWLTTTVTDYGISVTTTANTTSTIRWATVTIRSGTTAVETVVVGQLGQPTLAAGAATWAAPRTGGTTVRTVTLPQWDMVPAQLWEATSDADWLHVPAGTNVPGTTATLVADANTTGVARTAHVTFSARGATPVVVTVTQPK
ncbi:MAG: DUF4091 domain-containing protein [Bifidobacteriaceae bacterium]|nr:DUF4091 domain-containing protein [Bifidobacteriaceae bacterium]